MTKIPQEATTAAVAALRHRYPDGHVHALEDDARDVLEAAAPHIAAAERERIRQLSEKRRAVAAVDCQCDPVQHGPDVGHYVRFATLLADPEQVP